LNRGILSKKLREINKNYFIFYLLVIEIAVLSIAVPKGVFLSGENIMNALRQSTIVAIIAAGSFLVLLSGCIDLSVGSTVGLVGVFTAKLIVDYQLPVPAAFLGGIALALAIGAVNGLLVTRVRIPPFIVTLGTMEIVRGITYVITNAYPVSNLPPSIEVLGRGYLWIIPIPVIIMFMIYVITYLYADHSRMGRYVYAIGSSEEASFLSGIKVKSIRLYVYMIASFFAAISSLILLSRLASGQPNGGIGYEFQAITAAVLGGTSTSGGKGKILGVLFGALFIAIMNNGMVLLAVSSYFQQIARGLILILAVTFDVLKARRSGK